MKLKKKYKILFSLIAIIILFIVVVSSFYFISLGKTSKNDELKVITIDKGSSSVEIGEILKNNKMIKNKTTFLIYLKLNKINNLKFGSYQFSQNMGVKKIVKMLIDGSKYNPDEVTLTIKEGVNMRSIAQSISEVTNNSYDSVINKSNDIEYINSLKEKYWFITDSLDDDKLFYKLEGYLFPDTYKLTNKYVSVEYIFDKMLQEMDEKLSEYKNKINEDSELNIHQYLSLASMIEKEGALENDRKSIASVFMNRLKVNMALGSDVTTRYANKVDDPKQVLTAKQYQLKSPYNTRLSDGSMNGKLPIGPISTISTGSLDAAFNPSVNDYIYFIANIQTKETFFYSKYSEFLKKKNELQAVNGGF